MNDDDQDGEDADEPAPRRAARPSPPRRPAKEKPSRAETPGGRRLARAGKKIGFKLVSELEGDEGLGRWFEVREGENSALFLRQKPSLWHAFNAQDATVVHVVEPEDFVRGSIQLDEGETRRYRRLIYRAPEGMAEKYPGLAAAVIEEVREQFAPKTKSRPKTKKRAHSRGRR